MNGMVSGKSGRFISRVFSMTLILIVALLVATVWAGNDLGPTAVVQVEYLAVRSTPHRVTATVAQLFRGQVVGLTGYRSHDGQWVEVRLPGLDSGWVPLDAVRTRYPVADLSVTVSDDRPGGGGVAVVATRSLPVYASWQVPRQAKTYLGQDERVDLVGFRSADGNWVQVLLPNGQNGWVDARAIESTFPLSALAAIDPVE
jgi:uncharacterized protein YraI